MSFKMPPTSSAIAANILRRAPSRTPMVLRSRSVGCRSTDTSISFSARRREYCRSPTRSIPSQSLQSAACSPRVQFLGSGVIWMLSLSWSAQALKPVSARRTCQFTILAVRRQFQAGGKHFPPAGATRRLARRRSPVQNRIHHARDRSRRPGSQLYRACRPTGRCLRQRALE